MTGASLAELRDLARRSRRAQRWGFLAVLVALLLFPAQIVLARWLPVSYSAVVALAAGGALGLRYAYLAGEERGAFRRVFRRLAEDKRARRIVPTDARADATVVVQTER